MIISSLNQPHPQHHPSRVRPVNAETFHQVLCRRTSGDERHLYAITLPDKLGLTQWRGRRFRRTPLTVVVESGKERSPRVSTRLSLGLENELAGAGWCPIAEGDKTKHTRTVPLVIRRKGNPFPKRRVLTRTSTQDSKVVSLSEWES